MGSVDYALKQFSQPIPSTRKEDSRPEKTAARSVSFNPSTRFYNTEYEPHHLEGDKITPYGTESTNINEKKYAKDKKPETNGGFLSKYAKFETTMNEDPHFNAKEYHKQKKQLLERYWTKKITVN